MINNNLKKFRKEKEWSQFELAKRSDIPQSRISQIENGKIEAYPGWRKRISVALDVEGDKIFPENKQ